MGTVLEDAHHTAEPNSYISMLEKDLSLSPKPNVYFLQMSTSPADVRGRRKVLLGVVLFKVALDCNPPTSPHAT